VLYVATSFLYGTAEVHHTPSRIALSTDGGLAWSSLDEAPAQVAELLPVGGQSGAVYALTTASRTPLAMGEAPAISVPPAAQTAATSGLLAWMVAGLAAVALGFALVTDLRSRRAASGTAPAGPGAALEAQPVRPDQG
jgi:hypothetical protein